MTHDTDPDPRIYAGLPPADPVAECENPQPEGAPIMITKVFPNLTDTPKATVYHRPKQPAFVVLDLGTLEIFIPGSGHDAVVYLRAIRSELLTALDTLEQAPTPVTA